MIKKEFTKRDTLVAKGVAIILLLVYHLFSNESWLDALEVNYAPISLETMLLISNFGNICVAIFLFLTAYGITKGIMKQSEENHKLKPLMAQATKRWGGLTIHFICMYLSVTALWFTKFDYQGLYGAGWQGVLAAVLDAVGLAPLVGTPMLNPTWWYMELAVLFIFIVPLLYLLTKKIDTYILIIMFCLPYVFTLSFDVQRYFYVAVLGVVAAYKQWFEKLFAIKVNGYLKRLIGLAAVIITVLVRQNYMVFQNFAWFVDGFAAFIILWFISEVISVIPYVSGIFAFIGRHSMNIYFVHTFFYMMLYHQFIYSFRYAGLILLVLLVITLLYSIVLERIKGILKKYIKSIDYSKK